MRLFYKKGGYTMIPKTKHIFLTAVMSSCVQILFNSMLLGFISGVILLFVLFGGNKGSGRFAGRMVEWAIKIVERFNLPHGLGER
jgi:hypothetical protein